MPIRHGVHHGISFAFSIMLSVVLSELFRSILPGFIGIFDDMSKFIINLLRIHADIKFVSMLLVAVIVAIGYGIVYGIIERRRAD